MAVEGQHTCPSCGKVHEAGGYCTACGTPLQPAQTGEPAQATPSKRRASGVVIAIIVAVAIALLSCAGVVAVFALAPSDQPVPATTVDVGEDVDAVELEVIDTFGPPEQFIVAYLPRGDDELVRTEIWYYPEHEQKITFVQGRAVSIDPMDYPGDDVAYPDLAPDQFDFEMGYDDVMAVLGGEADKIDEVPELMEEFSVETYVNENAVFAIEDGKLVYVQTIGIGE